MMIDALFPVDKDFYKKKQDMVHVLLLIRAFACLEL